MDIMLNFYVMCFLKIFRNLILFSKFGKVFAIYI